MIGSLGHNNLRQQARPGRALSIGCGGLVAVFTVQAHTYFFHTSSMTVRVAI